MPPFDKSGGIIDPNELCFLRGDDAKEYIFPGSIPTLGETKASDPEEHDCLPPMENTGSWTLSGEGFKKLTEVIDEIIHSIDGLTFTTVHIGWKSRHNRKVVRWDERNRRRRLKGLPEKACPYPRIWKACIIEQKEDPDDERRQG